MTNESQKYNDRYPNLPRFDDLSQEIVNDSVLYSVLQWCRAEKYSDEQTLVIMVKALIEDKKNLWLALNDAKNAIDDERVDRACLEWWSKRKLIK